MSPHLAETSKHIALGARVALLVNHACERLVGVLKTWLTTSIVATPSRYPESNEGEETIGICTICRLAAVRVKGEASPGLAGP